MLCYALLCYAMLCYAMLCYAMLCCAVLCFAMPYYTLPYFTRAHGKTAPGLKFSLSPFLRYFFVSSCIWSWAVVVSVPGRLIWKVQFCTWPFILKSAIFLSCHWAETRPSWSCTCQQKWIDCSGPRCGDCSVLCVWVKLKTAIDIRGAPEHWGYSMMVLLIASCCCACMGAHARQQSLTPSSEFTKLYCV